MATEPESMGLPVADAALDAFWMPFTANRAFKQSPRMVARAHGHHYTTPDGRRILDSFSGLWTSGLGHGHPHIVQAVQRQVAEMDYAPGFQVSHPQAFELARRLCALAPAGFEHCFFTNSGSESVDSALKIALGYQRARGMATRTRFIGRERGYHGTNFGGMSVGGIPANRKMFSPALLGNVSHLRCTHDLEHNAFSRGQPAWGMHLADDLEWLVRLNDASNIAAVIVEPVAGSTGVLVPPVGYLEKLREICTRHDILLIFDEVITAFGRVGAAFGAERFGVLPDIICTAKGITNGVVPMGAVLVRDEIHEAFMHGPAEAIELFHGYTYSGHPLAVAAGLATLDVYEQENTFAVARSREQDFEDAIHAVRGARHVIDVRNFGLMGAIELAPRDGQPGARGLAAHIACWEAGLMVRNGMDILQFSPFLDAGRAEFDETFGIVARALEAID